MAKKEKETVTPEVEVEEAPPEVNPAEKELAETKDRLLRTLAEYDNFRKRSQKEKEQTYGDAKASVLTELLPVMDNFDRAANNADADLEDYKKGVEMIFNQFCEVFKKLGVEAFGASGDTFDPNIHNAVMHTEDDAQPENTVTDVFTKGYKMGERVLRPAIVKVVN